MMKEIIVLDERGRADARRIEDMERELAEQQAKIGKLQKTVGY